MSNNYQNFFETWAKIASDELAILPTGEFDLLKTKDWDIYAECKSLHTSFFDEAETFDTLQGYIQRCIKKRGWYYSLEELPDYAKADVRTNVGSQPNQVGSYDQNSSIVLLTAYLSALAAQRSPTPGAWQHFKGDVVEVVGVASWLKDDGFAPYYNFKLEEDPNTKIAFGYDEYYAFEDYGDRVFYSHASEQWARKTEDFLGLVGAEHPECQGKLRFTEVSHAKT